VENQSVENAIPIQSVTAVAPGSWAYVRRGQPNEESVVETIAILMIVPMAVERPIPPQQDAPEVLPRSI